MLTKTYKQHLFSWNAAVFVLKIQKRWNQRLSENSFKNREKIPRWHSQVMSYKNKHLHGHEHCNFSRNMQGFMSKSPETFKAIVDRRGSILGQNPDSFTINRFWQFYCRAYSDISIVVNILTDLPWKIFLHSTMEQYLTTTRI